MACNSESWKAMVPVCALLVSHAIPMSSADWSFLSGESDSLSSSGFRDSG